MFKLLSQKSLWPKIWVLTVMFASTFVLFKWLISTLNKTDYLLMTYVFVSLLIIAIWPVKEQKKP